MAPGPDDFFCSRPFSWLEVLDSSSGGTAYVCCSSWLPKPIGKLKDSKVSEIWNGPEVQDIRRSVLDGSFRHCIRARCPFLQSPGGPVSRRKDVRDPLMRRAIDEGLSVVPWGPLEINCAYDRSCNLSCPTCRTKVIVETKRERLILDIQEKLKAEAFKDARMIYVTGSGDPFGSPYFRRLLRELREEDMPSLEEFLLHSNAQLWTPENWAELSPAVRRKVNRAHISIDAAEPETYAVNRRGGTFDKLLKNLEFIAALRRDGPLKSLTISMVVQENNFRQMPAFVRLGKSFGVDTVYFKRFVNWGTFKEEEYAARAVHLPGHPAHEEFLGVLRAPELRLPGVTLGNLNDIRLGVA